MMKNFTLAVIAVAAVVFGCQSEESRESAPALQAQTPPPLQAIAPTLAGPQQPQLPAVNSAPPPPPPTPLFPIDDGMNKQPISREGGRSGKPSLPSGRPHVKPEDIDTDTLPDSIKNKIPAIPAKPAGRLPKRPTASVGKKKKVDQ